VELVAKKIVYILILVVFCLVNTTCKKATNYKFDLSGYWVGYSVGKNTVGDYVHIDIQKNNKGEYAGRTNAEGCHKSWSGKTRVFMDHLYIGNTKFKFVEEPVEISNGDSTWYHNWNLNKNIHGIVTAKMTLKNSVLHGNATYKFTRVMKY
jgi:hypothetical protein